MPLDILESSWTPPAHLPELRGAGEIAVDLETDDEGLRAGLGPGWATGRGHVLGVGVAWADGAVYVPVRHQDTENFSVEAVGAWLGGLFENCRVVFQNAAYDLGWSRAEWGLEPPRLIDDTMAMAVALDESRPSVDLDSICAACGVPGKDERLLREAAAAYGVDPKAGMRWLPARYVGAYGAADAAGTLASAQYMRPLLEADEVTQAYQLEMDLLPCTIEMRRRGIRIDTEAAERGAEELDIRRDAHLSELSRKLGRSVSIENVRSAAWMAKVCDEEGVAYGRTNPTRAHPGGLPSFQNDWMLQHEHWLPRLAARAIQMNDGAEKFLRTYILGFTHRGRIHATINQYRGEDGGARTHRVSYADPPLQQMPSRVRFKGDEETLEVVRRIRVCFLPEEGEVWHAPDYSQQEYRLIVHFAALLKLHKASEAVQRYVENPRTDYHQMVADMTGLPRPRAKDCNFAKAFGAGIPKFASMSGLSEEEATRVMNQYDEELPFVKQLGRKCGELADRRGYIKLIDGGRMHWNLWEPAWGGKHGGALPLERARERWPDKRLKRAYTHKAGNGLIQGSAAKMTKKGWLAIWRLGITPLIQMHDEFGQSVARTSAGREQAEAVVEAMLGAVELCVPVVVDSEFGANWGDAKHAAEEMF